MNRTEILDRLIDIKHKLFTPSNGHLLYYAGLTDEEIRAELELEEIKERINNAK